MQVYVALFTHQHGSDMAVYRTSESAEKWRDQLADDYWFDAFPDDEKPEDKTRMSQMYWDYMRDRCEEWFEIQVCDVME